MFTGIVQEVGKIQSLQNLRGGLALEVASRQGPFAQGESISVDGVCLTVTESTPSSFWCELSPETLKLTRARTYQIEAPVNLERALAMGDRMGGHWVSGHVDTVIRLTRKEEVQEFWKLQFSDVPSQVLPFLVHKGSISLNGVSLTLNQVDAQGFDVMIIPHTLERTNLRFLREGDGVNVEVDWMSKLVVQTVERLMKGKS